MVRSGGGGRKGPLYYFEDSSLDPLDFLLYFPGKSVCSPLEIFWGTNRDLILISEDNILEISLRASVSRNSSSKLPL